MSRGKKGKGVIEYDINGNELRRFISVTQTCRAIGYCDNYVRESCKGKRIINGKYYRFIDGGKIDNNSPVAITNKGIGMYSRLIKKGITQGSINKDNVQVLIDILNSVK